MEVVLIEAKIPAVSGHRQTSVCFTCSFELWLCVIKGPREQYVTWRSLGCRELHRPSHKHPQHPTHRPALHTGLHPSRYEQVDQGQLHQALWLVISQVSGSGLEGQNRMKNGGGEGAGGAPAGGTQLLQVMGG